ncbi:hypothetical protein BTH42_28030 [Burkholderia sp. SRS-W-2-2016]|uniref:helix-turn-helix transcriptional regulator n=1 Tax=Burkholderia sp. SRS-W-2-2016 TaxID=1926878 RepID=UPI00094ACD2E|nr:LuxR C-terminal-related transcriptional regulator [Burkholderia sp. SRS-W-2-2016]OLL28384.1 hypothetical protein BTH42_28030 [Burkholderia sp. SRS-W-2-2016]
MTANPGDDDSALFIADETGRILRSDAGAARLLALADGKPGGWSDTSLPGWLTPIFDAITGGGSRKAKSDGGLERENEAGRFVFRAYRLHRVAKNSGEVLYGISVVRQRALVSAITEAAAINGLSEQQRRVCIGILSGVSYSEIGRVLGIKESTVVDHVRRVYAKLDVHSRDELVRVLARAL